MMSGQYMLEHVIPDMKSELCRKRRRVFEEPKPSFESAISSSRQPDQKKLKNTLSQNYQNVFQESNNHRAEIDDAIQNRELLKLYAINRNLTGQIEVLKIEQKSILRQLEESRSKLAKLARKQQKTFKRYARAERARKALVYQKRYLLQPKDLGITTTKKPLLRFRAAVRVCIAVHRYVPAHFKGHSFIILFRLEFLRKKMGKENN